MPFDFRVIFSGICAFVPDPDGSFDDPAHRTGFFNSVTVLLPNMRRAKAVEGGNARDSHLARLELDSGQGWVSSGRLPDLIASTPKKDVYALNREQVSFRFTGEAATPAGIKILNFDKVPVPRPEEPKPKTNEDRFFWWVAKMERVVQGSDKVLDTLLSATAPEIIGRVKFDRGLFSTHEISRGVMQFKPINGGEVALRQRIARSIEVKVENVESVEILFENGGTQKSVSLNRASGDVVTVEIMNREVDHLLPTVSPPTNTGKFRLQPDIDFSTYYELASVQASPVIFPHELTDLQGLSIGGVCPPAAFSGKAAAAGSQSAPQPEAATRRVTVREEKAALRKRTRR